MSETPPLTNVSSQPTPTATTAASAAPPTFVGEEFTQFLELLTTQVQNQDPLEPLDSTAFVEQLATFSALEQQVQSNEYLKQILSAVEEA